MGNRQIKNVSIRTKTAMNMRNWRISRRVRGTDFASVLRAQFWALAPIESVVAAMVDDDGSSLDADVS